jgi:hypothetical protein
MFAGIIIIPNLQTTAHFNAYGACHNQCRQFAGIFDQYRTCFPDSDISAVTADNYDWLIADIEAKRNEMSLPAQLKIAEVARCPSAGTPLLTAVNRDAPDQIIVCCKFHQNEGESDRYVEMPALPAHDQQMVENNERAFYERFVRSKYIFGLQPHVQVMILFAFAAAAAFIFRKRT